MENFREKLRSFLDTELNNLINERCQKTNTVLDHGTKLQERLTDDIVSITCRICDEKLTPALLENIIEEKFEDESTGEDVLKRISFNRAPLDYCCEH